MLETGHLRRRRIHVARFNTASITVTATIFAQGNCMLSTQCARAKVMHYAAITIFLSRNKRCKFLLKGDWLRSLNIFVTGLCAVSLCMM